MQRDGGDRESLGSPRFHAISGPRLDLGTSIVLLVRWA